MKMVIIMLYKRILSAIIFFIIIATFIFGGSIPFFGFVCVLSILGIREYVNLLPEDFIKNKWVLIFLSLVMISYIYLVNNDYLNLPLGLIVIFIFLFLFIYHIAVNSYHNIIYNLGVNLLGLLYIAGGMSIFILLRDLSIPNFFETAPLWLALIATWATDIGAFFTGKYYGKKQLALKISPNKTIEGAIGGILFNLIAVSIFVIYLNSFSFYWIIYGVLSAIVAIIGDLFESSIKRDMEVKDTGDLMPGHGGVLDRFDSIIFSGAFTYYFLTLLL